MPHGPGTFIPTPGLGTGPVIDWCPPGQTEGGDWSRTIPADRIRIEVVGWHESVVTFFHDPDLASL